MLFWCLHLLIKLIDFCWCISLSQITLRFYFNLYLFSYRSQLNCLCFLHSVSQSTFCLTCKIICSRWNHLIYNLNGLCSFIKLEIVCIIIIECCIIAILFTDSSKKTLIENLLLFDCSTSTTGSVITFDSIVLVSKNWIWLISR